MKSKIPDFFHVRNAHFFRDDQIDHKKIFVFLSSVERRLNGESLCVCMCAFFICLRYGICMYRLSVFFNYNFIWIDKVVFYRMCGCVCEENEMKSLIFRREDRKKITIISFGCMWQLKTVI